MKKVASFTLALALMLSLVACGDKTTTSNPSSENTPPPVSKQDSSTADTPSAEESKPVEEDSDATTTTRPPASADLSKDWSSFQFELQGKLYTLPVKFSDLTADGWVMKDEAVLSETLEPDQYFVSYTTLVNSNQEDAEISVQFANLGDTSMSVKDCYVNSIQHAEYSWTKNTVLYFPGGIALGMTMDDVKALYGEPKDTSIATELKYQTENYTDLILTFTTDGSKIEKMRMTNTYLP